MYIQNIVKNIIKILFTLYTFEYLYSSTDKLKTELWKEIFDCLVHLSWLKNNSFHAPHINVLIY